MRLILKTLLAFCLPLALNAQVQFWNIADIEDASFQQARKENKVKSMALYRTDEHGKRLDADQPGETFEFNSNGQVTVHNRYKYSYTTRKWELLAVDSFFYNQTGKLTSYKSFEGNYRKQTGLTTVKFNVKNQPIRQDHFTFYDYQQQLDAYDLFEYNPKAQVTKATNYREKKINLTRTFKYNAAGQLQQHIFSSGNSKITYGFKWDTKGQLLSSTETNGSTNKTISYLYDGQGRRVSKTTNSSYEYDDKTEYKYSSNSPLPSSFYLQYSGTGGKTDRRHEYSEMYYQYFE